jgi:[ribosomal protein S18]-alanine N-acetyltransferase
VIRVVSATAAHVLRAARLEVESRIALDDPHFSLARELERPAGGLLLALDADADAVGALSWLRVADELHLLSVVVAERARGRGVGATLVDSGAALGREHGAAVFLLEVRKQNVGARRLYERLGFFPYGARRRYYPDGDDAIEYVLGLQAGAGDRFLPRLSISDP